jgi:hypothetical protein
MDGLRVYPKRRALPLSWEANACRVVVVVDVIGGRETDGQTFNMAKAGFMEGNLA